MVAFTGSPYEWDMIYFKIDGQDEIVNIALCEVLAEVKNIEYDRDRSLAVSGEKGGYTVCFTADTAKEKAKKFEIPANEFASTLEAELYDKKKKITRLAIQPEGELMVPEVQKLINI